MKIENLLENIGLDFKIVDETKKLKIIKIPSKFLIDRETFEYLDANSLPYCLLLQDITKNKYYYISLKKENNWIKSCFAGCDKEEIYLGKQVLNAQIQLEELGKKLSKYK